jgi:hypothetical protein
MSGEEEGKKEGAIATPDLDHQPHHAGEGFGQEVFTAGGEEEFQERLG